MGSQWSVAWLVTLAACGGSTQSRSPGGVDASSGDAGVDAAPIQEDASPADASPDAPAYRACMDDTGQVSATLKTCQSDSQCVIEQEQIDCCGTILYVGIDTASASEFGACQSSWLAHFPGCGCSSGQTKTEDGQITHPGMDAGAPQVHCADFTSNGGICLTYTP